jgi:hypothetical protein
MSILSFIPNSTRSRLGIKRDGGVMKKITLLVMLFLLSAPIAAIGGFDSIGLLGSKGKAAGCFCCVKETCVVTKNEADCKKIGGVKVKKCAECEKAKAK